MTATDEQVRIMKQERQKGRTQSQAAARANVRSRQTVAKYEKQRGYPSEVKQERRYLTRADAFAGDWTEVTEMLEQSPELEAKGLFEWLCEKYPGRYEANQLRTFQRRVSRWRGMNQEQVAVIEQKHRAGEVMQTDGTWLNGLQMQVQGEPFKGLLIHSVLPYSNWEWGVLAQSESLNAIALGIQHSLKKLGYVPIYHQTDNSSAATYALQGKDEEGQGQERGYSERYLSILTHYGLRPRRTHVGRPQENGDVESLNGGLKRAIEQQLLLRGHRHFETVAEVEAFVQGVMNKRNQNRQSQLNDEITVMKPLRVKDLVTRERLYVKVSQGSLVRVHKNSYSVPTSLIGRTVTAYVSEWEIEIYYGGKQMAQFPRLCGRHQHRINYRHVIGSLLRKPGGFRQYRYRDDLFPQLIFRQAWEQLQQWYEPRQADLIYLRILHLAARTLECEVACALELLVSQGQKWHEMDVTRLVEPTPIPVPELDVPTVRLTDYDRFLSEVNDDLA